MNASKKKRLLVLAVLAVVIGVAYYAYRRYGQPEFRYAGTLEATTIEIPARVATVIDSIPVREGDAIKKGQSLASLDCQEIRLAARLALDNFERAQKLRRAGAVSEEAFDQMQNRKQDSDTRLSWCEITSPVDGTVLNRYLEPSEWVNPGTKILSVADLSEVWAYIYVPQEVMSKLKVGSKVAGVLPELGERPFEGVIRKINEEAEFTPKNVQTQAERTRLVFGVKVAFANPSRDLKPGMTIEVPLQSEINSSRGE